MTAFQAPKGTQDVLAPESARWERLVASFAAAARASGYGLVVSPMFEDVAVFHRGVGDSTDIVSKEMYEFETKGHDRVALRPEGTASIVRAYVQHRPVLPWKAWYATPAFRYESPQRGRLRQHHQLGVEALGSEDPDLDVEVVALLAGILSAVGLREITLRINSMGDQHCLPGYRGLLASYLAAHEGELRDEHARTWKRNPLRVLDCRDAACVAVRERAPRLSDSLCEACRVHFAAVVAGLDDLGIASVHDDWLVRGFDYYTRTTFEFASTRLDGSQDAVGGGGRYDGLVQLLGGPPTPGVGFAAGIERILLACDLEGVFGLQGGDLDAFVVDLTGGGAARRLCHELRDLGFLVDRAFDQRSMKAQLKAADRSGAAVALIVGDRDREADAVTLRELRDEGRGQHVVRRADLAARLAEIVGSPGLRATGLASSLERHLHEKAPA